MQVDVKSPRSYVGVRALFKHFSIVVPAIHSIGLLPQTHVDVSLVPLHVLWMMSLLLPQVSSLDPHKHFPRLTPAVSSQRGSHAGQSEFALHAAQIGAVGSVVLSHLGVRDPVASQASLVPQLHSPAVPGVEHLSAASGLQIPEFGGLCPVLH